MGARVTTPADEPQCPCEVCGLVGTWSEPCLCTVRMAARIAAAAIVLLFGLVGTLMARSAASDVPSSVSSNQLVVPLMVFVSAIGVVGMAVYKLGRYSGAQDQRFQKIEEDGSARGKELRAVKDTLARMDRELSRLLGRWGMLPEPAGEEQSDRET